MNQQDIDIFENWEFELDMIGVLDPDAILKHCLNAPLVVRRVNPALLREAELYAQAASLAKMKRI
ncbi:hypothetical protein ABWL39_09100 [Chitinivorax sp. PXF-14]|uniref:hypothetical protein n=1 Tax=Chitinivorax sp. PXF-14 TaxID=3230488 RepID=UPI003464F4D3